jgi:hypothetical protein
LALLPRPLTDLPSSTGHRPGLRHQHRRDRASLIGADRPPAATSLFSSSPPPPALQRRLLPITATPPLHSQHWVLHGRSVTGEEEKNSRHKTKIKADLGKKNGLKSTVCWVFVLRCRSP